MRTEQHNPSCMDLRREESENSLVLSVWDMSGLVGGQVMFSSKGHRECGEFFPGRGMRGSRNGRRVHSVRGRSSSLAEGSTVEGSLLRPVERSDDLNLDPCSLRPATWI